ncbi:MAG: bifunctional 3-deoxy-7-phosphoheptulonate synthase/chorismate mutase type II [Chitinophagaceae bacterium]|nr:bifunctional 3-deoxy-7-phosphoheptulonate synthase/chorismate mutase type II [Chitinophagaceae bacterium]
MFTKRPFIIAGPCSAETQEQLMQTAINLKSNTNIDLFRAGIWKPRTRPGQFEGVGKVGLQWLQQVKNETGLATTIEVANTVQVDEALKHNIDVLWLGARTVANPFSVQEIATALQGVNIPILIKNPTNPDLELWTGAVERISKAGITNIGLVHRGFSVYGNDEYRNAPMWHLAIEMKRRHPEKMFLCDPSHIAGNRNILQAISQKSIDLNYDGLMIESHISPDNAWSDAKQQITPNILSSLLAKLIWRNEFAECNEDKNLLENLRQSINLLDDELIQLLGKRMKIADTIGRFKKDNNITILQTSRWNEILLKIFSKGEELGLSKEFLTKYFDAVHMESINHQNKVMNDDIQ